MKKSEKVLKNRVMTIDELQKDINSVSDTFQVYFLPKMTFPFHPDIRFTQIFCFSLVQFKIKLSMVKSNIAVHQHHL